jgi:hypothetical protein
VEDRIVDLLLYVVILLIVFGAIFYVIQLLPIPYPFGLIAQIVVGVILVVFLLSLLVGVYPFRGPLIVR